jgi:nucleoside-diphosphate-sugar epimerase
MRADPGLIENEADLEERLSRPSEADTAAMRELGGDLLILGAGGKMGPSLAQRARRAADASGVRLRVTAVSRFSDARARQRLEEAGVDTITADLLDRDQLRRIPEAPNVVFMAGRKFGSTGAEALTWAMNAYLPALVIERFRQARIVAFSSGNVYPFVPVSSGGCAEECPPGPVGEYAQSVLARERVLEYFSLQHGTRVTLLRLNYAVELRYGVLLDIGTRVFEQRSVPLSVGAVNVIWQGDANSACLRSFRLCASPPAILNITGEEILLVRNIAARFGQLLGRDPIFDATESESALLNDASRCHALLGPPEVSLDRLLEWTAHWIKIGGTTLNKPTHFEAQDGRF